MNQAQTNNRVALVTGAMGGLGTAICKALADSGHKVVANEIANNPKKDEWLAQMSQEKYEMHVAEADVSDYDDCKKMVEEVKNEHGSIDVLVNNAGITRDASFRNMDKKAWDAVLRVNLDSVFNVTHNALPIMVENKWGRVINVSSLNGVKGQAGQANYSSAKAGMLGFTKTLAAEVARRGVTVNAVAPGYIATDMVMAIKEEILNMIVDQIPMKRLAQPAEIAAMVNYLASDDAAYVTGATFNINGGMHMY